jgi:hypothetical protein
MQLYVKGKSKKEINERLAAGAAVYGENYSMFDGGGTYKLDGSLPDDTVIKVFEKTVGGSPYAKAYGTWNAAKNKIA